LQIEKPCGIKYKTFSLHGSYSTEWIYVQVKFLSFFCLVDQ
jgi:hypothetical protein